MSRVPAVGGVIAMVALAVPIFLLGTDADEPREIKARADLEPVSDRRGALALGGVVVDGAGEPVPGVAIAAVLESPGPLFEPVVASSDVDGRFALDGLHAGRYRLAIEGAEIVAAEVRSVVVPRDDVRIVVARRIEISGRVLDGAFPVAGATVEIADGGGRITRTTDVGGQFAFEMVPEGRYRIRAWKGDLGSRGQDVLPLGSGPHAGVVIAIEPAAIVVGKVVERGAERGVAAAIELRPVGEGGEPRYARSGEDGVFRIEGVPHGRWVADAWSPARVTVGTVEFDAGRGVPQIEVADGGVIEGRVVDDRGDPIAGAVVRAVTDGGREASELGFAQRLRRYSGMAPTDVRTPAARPVASLDPRFMPRGELGVLAGPIPFPPPAVSQSADTAIQAIVVVGLGDPVPLTSEPAPVWTTAVDGRFASSVSAPDVS
jgi:hypothetical protein